MNRHASTDNHEATSPSHHELVEEIAQLKERERVLVSEKDQLRAQLTLMKEEAHKKYDDLMVEYYNIKREDEDVTANNQVTLKTEWDHEEVKVEIKEEEHDIIIKQEYAPAYIKTESNDVKIEIKEEIKEEDDEDDHQDDCVHDLRLVKKELVSDDDDNSMQIDDPVNVDEVMQPNLNHSPVQLNTPTNSVCAPSGNEQMQLTNSSQTEQSVGQQVDKADHEPNEPDNHGHNQLPTTKQSQTRKRKSLTTEGSSHENSSTSSQVSTPGPKKISKRTRVSSLLDRTETVQEVSTAVALDEREGDEQNGGGGGLGQIEDDDDETELGEDEGGRYKIEIVKLKCTEDGCEDEVASRDELHDHLRVIHRVSPFQCLAERCNERFEQRGELGLHVRDNHSNISIWPCTHCTKTFQTQSLLFIHLHFNHFEGQFKCGYDGCHYDRVATFRSEIKNHQKSVHPTTTRTTIFTCQFPNCGKSFIHKAHFNRHQQSHNGVKPFPCDWTGCGKSFSQKHHLNIHQRIHQKVKPFKCTWAMCGYAQWRSQGGALGARAPKRILKSYEATEGTLLHLESIIQKCVVVHPNQVWSGYATGYAATNQSDVITHIRTQHFNLPRSQKAQHQLGIEDNRNPRDYLQQEHPPI